MINCINAVTADLLIGAFAEFTLKTKSLMNHFKSITGNKLTNKRQK